MVSWLLTGAPEQRYWQNRETANVGLDSSVGRAPARQSGGRRFKSRSSQFSLFIQIYLKSVPSQFPLWFITWCFNPFASEAVYTRNFFSTACRTACKHAFCFLRVLPEAVSTRHSWLWQTLDDVYTRRCFSDSEGTCFGAPGQKALPSGNEWMDFCLIPLSTTCSVEVPGTNL